MKMSKKSAKLRSGLINELLEKCLFYSTRNEHNQDRLIEEYTELNLIATNIRKIEKGLFVPPRREDHLQGFISWLSSNDCPCEIFDISCIDKRTNEYGLVTKKVIPEDEIVLQIPKKIMMTTETALADSCLKSATLEDTLLKTMPNVLLTFHLMNEYCRKDSFWKPYLLFLPSTYSTPLYFTKDDLLLLKGSPVLAEAVKLIRSIYRQYAYFWKRLSTKSSSLSELSLLKGFYSLDLYRWAISTVMTRQNQIPSSSETDNPESLPSTMSALIPLWDLCNHQNGKFTSDYDPLRCQLVCYAMKDFQANEEITIFYGKRTNAEFLVHNGFVPSDNPFDSIFLRLGLSQVDPLYALRSKLCSQMNLPKTGYFPLHHKTIYLDKSSLNFVKIFLMDKIMLDQLLESDKGVDRFNDLTDDMTVKVINFISIRCQILLKSYPTLDNKQNNLSLCGQHIVQLIDSEKKILSSYDIKSQTESKN